MGYGGDVVVVMDAESMIESVPDDLWREYRLVAWDLLSRSSDDPRIPQLDRRLGDLAFLVANVLEGDGNCAPVSIMRSQLDWWVSVGAPDPPLRTVECGECGESVGEPISGEQRRQRYARGGVCCERCHEEFYPGEDLEREDPTLAYLGQLTPCLVLPDTLEEFLAQQVPRAPYSPW